VEYGKHIRATQIADGGRVPRQGGLAANGRGQLTDGAARDNILAMADAWEVKAEAAEADEALSRPFPILR